MTLVLQTPFDVRSVVVVLLIVEVVGLRKIPDPIISSGMTPAKKMIRTIELLTELN